MKKCLNCGKTEDLCECGFFESDESDETEDGDLAGMSIKEADGTPVEDEVNDEGSGEEEI